MKPRPSVALVLFLLLGRAGQAAPARGSAEEEGPRLAGVKAGPRGVYVRLRLEGAVDLGMAPLVTRALETARERRAEALFLELDTLGGRVDAALRIRDALLDAGLPTTCWVNERAISAGALICLAADTIDMRPGATIGAATPVSIGPTGETTPVDEKFTSYLRKEFASTAEARGRRPEVAEAMVDRDVVVEGVSEAGKLLTLTTNEALAVGMADRSSPDLAGALGAAGLDDLEAVDVVMNWAERVARVISEPVLAGLLLTLGFLGLIFEVKTPGWGVPGTVGAIALVLFFAGHHVVQLAGWEDVLLVGLGIVLLAVEVFVLPGFGIAGIAGLFSLLAGLLLAMVGRDWEAAVALGSLREALLTLAGSIVAFAAGLVVLLVYLPTSPLMRRTLVLTEAIGGGEAGTGDTAYGPRPESLVGRPGVAHTLLRPSGSVLVDGQRHDAVSEGDVVPPGTPIRVVGVRGGSLVVRAAPPAAEGQATRETT
jgi:membrane-bound serine protease (ClpP class)